MLILTQILSLELERLFGVDGSYRCGPVNGRRIDVGQGIERRGRGRVDDGGNGSGGSKVGPARDGLDLEREPGSLGWVLLLLDRHCCRWTAADSREGSMVARASRKVYKKRSRVARAKRHSEDGLVLLKPKRTQIQDTGLDPVRLWRNMKRALLEK